MRRRRERERERCTANFPYGDLFLGYLPLICDCCCWRKTYWQTLIAETSRQFEILIGKLINECHCLQFPCPLKWKKRFLASGFWDYLFIYAFHHTECWTELSRLMFNFMLLIHDLPYAAKFYDCCGAKDPDASGCATSFHVSYDDDWCNILFLITYISNVH